MLASALLLSLLGDDTLKLFTQAKSEYCCTADNQVIFLHLIRVYTIAPNPSDWFTLKHSCVRIEYVGFLG